VGHHTSSGGERSTAVSRINCHGVNASPTTKPNHNVGTTRGKCHSLGGAGDWHDTLIPWVVNSGQVPGSVLARAPPHSSAAWIRKVEAWIAAGAPCP
jgi:hypothetical protein